MAVVFFKDYFGFTQSDMSDLLLVTSISALVLTPLLPVLLQYLGETRGCMVGTAGVGFTTLFLILGVGIHWVPTAAAGLSVGFFGSISGLGYMALVHHHVPPDRLGMFLGIKSFVDGAAGAVSPAAGGFIYTKGHFLPYGITCGLCTLTAAIFAALTPYKRVREKSLSLDEEEPMLSKDIESDDEGDGLPVTTFMSENLQFSRQSLLKLMTNEIGILMHDDQLKSLFYDQNKFQDKKGLRRGATIGVENFAKAAEGQASVRRLRQLRGSTTKPELPPVDPTPPLRAQLCPVLAVVVLRKTISGCHGFRTGAASTMTGALTLSEDWDTHLAMSRWMEASTIVYLENAFEQMIISTV
ncbi:ZIFL1 [Symbiodinium natans]|uniref:ZIFL1 protein n=1 Tax=Symbiodinium natans TaxID=878477 RepID=A0A812K1J7_9DINO|nr:ZIFL1 [Symbiodinium natans]